MYSICELSIIPLRREPSDRSEMISQILFGEVAEVSAVEGSWSKIKLEYDGYTGWVDTKQLNLISDGEFLKIIGAPKYVSKDFNQMIVLEDGTQMQILPGSSLPFYSNQQFRISGLSYEFNGQVIHTDTMDARKWMDYALMYLNAPYLWGGRSPFGIDCSGFTQMVMKFCGIRIQRDAIQQAEQGTIINMIDEAKPGDLAFFENTEGRIVHVGIILPEGKIIHASGKVRIDKLDHQGIYNSALKKYTHNLRLIRRFI